MDFLGRTLNDRYRIGDDGLESWFGGAHSEVYIAIDQHNNQQKVAIKIAAKDYISNLETEAMILKRLNHPAIPKFIEFFIYEGKSCLAMEFFPGKVLYKFWDVTETLIEDFSLQISKVLDYIHEESIIHNDVNCQNIIINDNKFYLIDFSKSSENSPDNGVDKKHLDEVVNNLRKRLRG